MSEAATLARNLRKTLALRVRQIRNCYEPEDTEGT